MSGTPIACNLNAFSAEERARHGDLMERLRAAVVEETELADGYAYKLKPNGMSVPEFGEWFDLERMCCQFLSAEIEIEIEGDAVSQLILRGPEGAKEVLREEFPDKSRHHVSDRSTRFLP